MIYIVDDEKSITEILQQILEYEGYQSKVFNCGVEFLDTVRSGDIILNSSDRVLLDINLPSINGFQVAQTLSEYTPYSQSCIIFMTGYSSTLADSPFHDYKVLNKPFNLNDFIKSLYEKGTPEQIISPPHTQTDYC